MNEQAELPAQQLMRRIKRERNLTYMELSELLGISKHQVERIAGGKETKIVQEKTLYRMAEVAKLPPEERASLFLANSVARLPPAHRETIPVEAPVTTAQGDRVRVTSEFVPHIELDEDRRLEYPRMDREDRMATLRNLPQEELHDVQWALKEGEVACLIAARGLPSLKLPVVAALDLSGAAHDGSYVLAQPPEGIAEPFQVRKVDRVLHLHATRDDRVVIYNPESPITAMATTIIGTISRVLHAKL